MSPKALPEKPRVRASYWYEGAQLKLEITLMDEQRERVHREVIAVAPGGALFKIFSVLAGLASSRAVESGFATSDTAPALELPVIVPELSRDQVDSARAERAGRAKASEPESEEALWVKPEDEPEPELEPELSSEQLDNIRAERAERANAVALEPEAHTAPENALEPVLEPEPEAQLSSDELAAERLRRAGKTLVDNSQPPPEE